jgi:hypothetical protein
MSYINKQAMEILKSVGNFMYKSMASVQFLDPTIPILNVLDGFFYDQEYNYEGPYSSQMPNKSYPDYLYQDYSHNETLGFDKSSEIDMFLKNIEKKYHSMVVGYNDDKYSKMNKNRHIVVNPGLPRKTNLIDWTKVRPENKMGGNNINNQMNSINPMTYQTKGFHNPHLNEINIPQGKGKQKLVMNDVNINKPKLSGHELMLQEFFEEYSHYSTQLHYIYMRALICGENPCEEPGPSDINERITFALVCLLVGQKEKVKRLEFFQKVRIDVRKTILTHKPKNLELIKYVINR